jgi:hypothetical protein
LREKQKRRWIVISRSGTVTTMTLSTRLAILAGLMFSVGWVLVFASGHGGNSTGGSEVVWQIGGIMVYASVPLGLAVVVGTLVVGMVRRRRSHGEGPGGSLS